MPTSPASPAAQVLAELDRAGLARPRVLTVAITDLCNLDCSHCLVDAGPCSDGNYVAPDRLLSLVWEFLAIGGEELRLTGGEPLCHPDWRSLLQAAASVGLQRLSLQTNATLIDEVVAEQLQALGTRFALQVSLDGATEQSHDRLRGTGNFAKALSGLRTLAKSGLARQTTIHFTETRHNLEEFPDLLALAESMGIAKVTGGTLLTGGRAAEAAVDQPTTEQYLQLLRHYEQSPVFRESYTRLGNLAALEWHLGREQSACCALVEQPYLTTDGSLYPCTLFHAEPFAVKETWRRGLTEALSYGAATWGPLRDQCRQRREQPTCRRGKLQDSCAAGCPGRAWGSHGDHMAVDDRCELRQRISRNRPT